MKVIKTWQQLAWWCTVAAACQGGHYCSAVPYAFFLLSYPKYDVSNCNLNGWKKGLKLTLE